MGNTAGYYTVTNNPNKNSHHSFSPSYKAVKKLKLKKETNQEYIENDTKSIHKINLKEINLDSPSPKNSCIAKVPYGNPYMIPGFPVGQFRNKRCVSDSKIYSQSDRLIPIHIPRPRKNTISLDNLSLPDDPFDTKVTYPFQFFASKDRPIIFTSNNASDWRLGTILEESGESTIKRRCFSENSGVDSSINYNHYESSGDEDSVLVERNFINIKNIQAERKKEEEIQKSLECYESLERIEKCLTASIKSDSTHESKSYKSAMSLASNYLNHNRKLTRSEPHYVSEYHYTTYSKREKKSKGFIPPKSKSVEELGSSKIEEDDSHRRQSSLDVPKVIESNPDSTYIKFGSGIEADIDIVVSSSQASIEGDSPQMSALFHEETSKSVPCLDMRRSFEKEKLVNQCENSQKYSLPEDINVKSRFHKNNPICLSPFLKSRRRSTDDFLEILNKPNTKEEEPVEKRWNKNFFKKDQSLELSFKNELLSSDQSLIQIIPHKILPPTSLPIIKNYCMESPKNNRFHLYEKNSRYSKSADFAGKLYV